MSDELRDKLVSEVLPCGWRDLAPHQKRDGLLLVRHDLDLIEAAMALATDRSDRVGVWLTIGRLGRVDDALAAQHAAKGARYQFVIVQPWVLAQELPG